MQGKKEVSFSRTCITTQLAFLVPVYMTALTKTYVCISKTEVQGQGVPVSVCPSLCAISRFVWVSLQALSSPPTSRVESCLWGMLVIMLPCYCH